jgi:hypothetical protein
MCLERYAGDVPRFTPLERRAAAETQRGPIRWPAVPQLG